ncbi:MAG: SIS domain-containing protein [Erysipelotrichaceae bacterium]|nr:SIS domain-containing protein [Erysipelotrichaceae bacterium]
MNDYTQDIKDYIVLEKDVLSRLDVNSINEVLNCLVKTQENGNTVFVFGNGGSGSTSSHFQNDFNKGLSEHLDKKFNFLCLNDNVSTMLAVANDSSYDEIFKFQLEGHLKPGDVVMALSGSGNSKNIIKAVEYAKQCGNTVIGLTGYDGGKLKQMCDISLHVPVNSMQMTEDIHMVFDHLMMSVLYLRMCGINHVR